jgi:hypothetical protein
MVDGKSFRLADEVRYIQRRAAEHDERIVTVGQLFFFSTETEMHGCSMPSITYTVSRDGLSSTWTITAAG